MIIPGQEQQKDSQTPSHGIKRKIRFTRRAAALIFVPVVFIFITAFSLYSAFEPIVGPYVRLAMLAVGPQGMADRELRDLFAEAPAPEPDREPVEWVAVEDHSNPPEPEDPEIPEFINASDIILPRLGELYAHITISGTTVDAPVFWGDSEIELNKGVGTYAGGWLPGFGRTIIMAGHRNSDFYDFRSVEVGAIITIVTHYETYTYEVVRMAVHHMHDTSSYDLLRDDENLILYTCYPFDFIGAARERLFVYGMPLTGLPVARYS
jgi:sortase A